MRHDENVTLLANPAWPRQLARWLGPETKPEPRDQQPLDDEAERRASPETPHWPRVFPGL